MEEDNKNTKVDNTDKKLHISDVICNATFLLRIKFCVYIFLFYFFPPHKIKNKKLYFLILKYQFLYCLF